MPGGTGSRARWRQHLLDQYRSAQMAPVAEPGPCREPGLLRGARLYLRRAPRPGGVFTVFPFYQAVTGGAPGARAPLSRKSLTAFIKASELLETFSAHILQQPWRSEIRTIRSFTGVFVYHLLPVLSGSVLQSVLQSLGYLPDVEACPSQFSLREDVDMDGVMLLGFELMLARLEGSHLLKELQRENLDTLDHTKLLEVLPKREKSSDQKDEMDGKTPGQEQEEQQEEQQKEESGLTCQKKLLTTEQKQMQHVKPFLNQLLETEPADVSAPRAQRHTWTTVDHSIMEMQRTYPDLAFRGRRLLAGPPSKFPSSERFAAGVGAAAPVQRSSGDHSSAGVELRAPQAVSLHITLRTGAPGKYLPEVSSMSEELQEQMGQLCVQEKGDAVRRTQDGEECPQRQTNQ